MKNVIGYLIFKRVHISGANSISSPLTYGFPNISGFLGAFHAMSRRFSGDEELNEYHLGGVLLACHDCQPQVYRPNRYRDYTFIQSRNPIQKGGKPASIIEEGKCHLTMTFVVEVLSEYDLSDEEAQVLVSKSTRWIQQQRIAGGSVHGMTKTEPVCYIKSASVDDIVPLLMPAFVLMDVRKEFIDIIQEIRNTNPETTPLDALIEVCTLHHTPEEQKNGAVVWNTTSHKIGRGWLVPMPIGYQGISEAYDAGVMKNVRNPEYPSQYVEAIYSLGKWIYPQRLENIKQAFWHYTYYVDNQSYLFTQDD